MAQYESRKPRRHPAQEPRQSKPAPQFSKTGVNPTEHIFPTFRPGMLGQPLEPAAPSPHSGFSGARSLQSKLTLGQVNDPYEQEADRVARQVVNQLQRPQLQAQPLNPIANIQAKGDLGGGAVSPDVEQGIQQAKGGGQALNPATQNQMGSAMGADFEQVRVHTDQRADQLNQAVQARAFTTGPDIFFKRGEYNPSSRGGQELLAHELTHVVQQGAALQRKPNKPTIQLSQTLQPQRFGVGKTEAITESRSQQRVAQLKALTQQPTGLMQVIPTPGWVQRVTTGSPETDDATTAQSGGTDNVLAAPQSQDANTDNAVASQDNASGNAPAQQDDSEAKSKVEEAKKKSEEAKKKSEEAKKKSEEAKKKILGKKTLTKFSETGNYDKMIDPDAAEELAYKIVTQLNGLIRAREISLIKSDHGTTVEFLMAKEVDMMKLKAFPSIHSKKNKGLMATYEGCTKKEDTTSKRRLDDVQTYYKYSFRFGMFATSKVIEDYKDVGTAAAGLGSAVGHANLPELWHEDITDKDAYTIYDKVQLMLTALKEGGDEVPGQILEIVGSSIFGTVLSFGFALKRFADLEIYQQRLEGLQASQEKLHQKAQQPNAQVDAGLQEGITYAIEKVKKLMGHTLVKAVGSLVQALSRVFTILFSALFPPAAIISLCAELTALTAKAADFLYRKGKGIVKFVTGQRGVKRFESAESIYSAAVGGDSEALEAIRALNIKTIVQQTTDFLSQKITQKKPNMSMTSIDTRSISCQKIIDKYSRKGGTKWMTGINLVEKVLSETIIKQSLKNVLKEKNIAINVGQITDREVRNHTTPNELMAMVSSSILRRDMQEVNDENLVVYLQRFNQHPAVRKNFVQSLANQMKSSDYT